MEINKETGAVEAPHVRPRWWRKRVQKEFFEPSMTVQSLQEAADINVIVAKYEATGQMPPGRHQGMYGDVTGYQGDITERYQRAQETIQKAGSYFEEREKERRKQKQNNDKKTEENIQKPVEKTVEPAPSTPSEKT